VSDSGLPHLYSGKVRELFEVGLDALLMVASDRISVFDVVLPDLIPDKGRVLTALSNFWFGRLASIVPNHLTGIDPESVVTPEEREQVRGRSVVVKRMQPLPIEAVVRGYLEGSGWAEYSTSGTVCGIPLPKGLQRASKLPEPIFTPATKAEAGHHDENITFERMASIVGRSRAEEVRRVAIQLYQAAAEYALERGIIIADTKFEFGLDREDRLHLIDEALTPDSSRFWPLATWRVGASPESFDKQYVRNWLDSIGFARKPPAPEMPAEVALKTSDKYQEALKRLMG
jgi:phosphoribosylaminoimidazole-succinocarboxamide synthase